MKSFNIHSILSVINTITYSGKDDFDILELIDLANETPNSQTQLFWCNEKNTAKLATLNGGTVILSKSSFDFCKNDRLNYIVVEKPRTAFKQVLEKFFMLPANSHHISNSAKIDKSVVYSEDIYIGENVVIENGCKFGKNVSIGHNTVIHSGTVVNDYVKIGCNNTIGSVGFGYEKNEDGEWEVIPHIGNVVIHDHVEIGNNNCIDRAVLGSTVIGSNVKIDNLVHIAHGVKIGKNSLIIAHAMIGGSAIIGDNVWVGPSSSIINKGSVKNNGFIGMGAVIIKPVEENSVVAGNPAKHLRDNI
jgi:UDP-3-O-[3-hydroxymyristoyl] glucosamine N-acyltransferase